MQVVPAIIPENQSALSSKLASLAGQVKWVHLDVNDGKFTPAADGMRPEWLPLAAEFQREIHLMIEHPEISLDDWRQAERLIIHYEAIESLEDVLRSVTNQEKKIGLALLLSTPLSALDSVIDKVNLIQLMGIKNIGWQGQLFEEETIERVITLKRRYPDVAVSVDGGVTLEVARRIITAGADQIVVGSAVWTGGQPLKSLAAFRAL